mmetsp:Transcript_21855/g.39848  ORF Transcript_21855/g.39848 Transcript_21855/m.39848 type:complete len:565 (+) Transcript_21855:40-1734(+)
MLWQISLFVAVSSFAYACKTECLTACVAGNATECLDLCMCKEEHAIKVELEDGQEYILKKATNPDVSLEAELGCDVECSQTCLRFATGFGLISCQEYCGCHDLIFKVTWGKGKNGTKGEYTVIIDPLAVSPPLSPVPRSPPNTTTDSGSDNKTLPEQPSGTPAPVLPVPVPVAPEASTNSTSAPSTPTSQESAPSSSSQDSKSSDSSVQEPATNSEPADQKQPAAPVPDASPVVPLIPAVEPSTPAAPSENQTVTSNDSASNETATPPASSQETPEAPTEPEAPLSIESVIPVVPASSEQAKSDEPVLVVPDALAPANNTQTENVTVEVVPIAVEVPKKEEVPLSTEAPASSEDSTSDAFGSSENSTSSAAQDSPVLPASTSDSSLSTPSVTPAVPATSVEIPSSASSSSEASVSSNETQTPQPSVSAPEASASPNATDTLPVDVAPQTAQNEAAPLNVDPSATGEAVQPINTMGFIPRVTLASCETQCIALCNNLSQDDVCLMNCKSNFCTAIVEQPSRWHLWVLSALLFSVAFAIYWALNNLGKKNSRPYEAELSQYYRLSD